jgi:hypothetical protein
VRDEAGNDVPLVASEVQLAKSRIADPQEFPPRWTWQALAAGLASALLLLGLARMRSRPWARVAFASAASLIAVICGSAGLILLGLWTLTDHVSAWRNENLLLFNPLCLLLLPTWLARLRQRWQPSRFAQRIALAVAFCAVLAWFVKILPGFVQDNRAWIALLLPIDLALAQIALTKNRTP